MESSSIKPTTGAPSGQVLYENQKGAAKPKGIDVADWKIAINKTHILDSLQLDKLKEELQVPSLPEMVFGNNRFDFVNVKSGFHLQFNVTDALKCWDYKNHSLKVATASQWTAGASADIKQYKVPMKDFDWTFTTTYKGTLLDASFPAPERTTEAIPIDKLKREDPILFFDEMVLFEDELGDNGSAMLTLKARVMPACFFILLQYYLRVDDVLFRTIETRIYHEFGTDYMLREYQVREGPYAHVKSLLPPDPSAIMDPRLVYPLLTPRDLYTEKVKIQK